jgi:DNA replication ATP-dependent helicase Dna2
MPGTGKSTTIAHIVRNLSQNGKRVLIAAYTHSAVDTVCLKLTEIGMDYLRVGSSKRIDVSLSPSKFSIFEKTK